MIKAAGFRYIPKGAMKVADKKSDAVAYLYDTINGRPAAQVYYGNQKKPVLHGSFMGTEEKAKAQRIATVRYYFEARQKRQAFMAERRATRNAAAKAGKVEVGSYFYTSWGYDQTNIDWYRVEKLIGKTMALVVEVGAVNTASDGWAQGKSIPGDAPKGEPFRVRLNGDGFRVDGHLAYRWDGRPQSWTAYA